MKLTKNFTREEFEKSSTAKQLGIDNTVPTELEGNLKELAKTLQVIRNEFGEPIIVSSGYRSPELNDAVKGATNSDHKFAAAADIHTISDTLTSNKKLYQLIVNLAKADKIKCRQIIWEYGKKKTGPDWIHISINHPGNDMRSNQLVFIGV